MPEENRKDLTQKSLKESHWCKARKLGICNRWKVKLWLMKRYIVYVNEHGIGLSVE